MNYNYFVTLQAENPNKEDMKRTPCLIYVALLSVTACVQNALAQKVTLYMADNQTFECDIARLDSIVFSEGQTNPSDEIVVTVDANGNADGGHQFTRIDETTFLIDGLKYYYENGNLIVIGYDPILFTGKATIISKLIYNGRALNVVRIANDVFKKCNVLTSIIISNGITNINEQAFYECTSLTSVTIGSGVTIIGKQAFYGCSSLTSITIPNNVTTIGHWAFEKCHDLTSVTIGKGVTSVGKSVFANCESLTSVTILCRNTTFNACAFEGCTGLKKVIVPDISVLCNATFSGYDSNPLYYAHHLLVDEDREITNLVIPDSVINIGQWAFVGCNKLTSVTIPNSVTSIGDNAFHGCTSLTSVTIGNSVTSIGNTVFTLSSDLIDVYCYATMPPSCIATNEWLLTFDISHVSEYTTLHVPAGSVEAYSTTQPWKSFKNIVAIE